MRWFICMINLIAIYQIISVKNALFEELKDSFVSYWFKERRKTTFYKSIIDESIRNFPELDIFLFFQIFSEKFLNDCGFWTINLFCYLINSICLIFLIFFNFSNKYYSLFDYVILFITFFIMYFSLSIYSLIILEKCSEDTKNLIKKLIPSAIIYLDSKYKYETYQLKSFKKNLKKLFEVIANSVNIILDASIKALSFYLKILLNKKIYENFNYSINRKFFSVFFSIYFVCGLMSIILFKILDYCEKRNEKSEGNKVDNDNNKNNNDKEEIEPLKKKDESKVNYFGSISYSYKRNYLKEPINKIKENEDLIKLSDIKKNIEQKFDENKKIKNIINKYNDEKINEITYDRKVRKKIAMNVTELKKFKENIIKTSLKKIFNRKYKFILIYEKEGLISYFWNYIKKNNLLIFMSIYFVYLISSMNFYNIIENNYIEKKKNEFLISNYNKYFLFIFVYGFAIGMLNFFTLMYKNFKKYYIYLMLFVINIFVIKFYLLNLSKNYYNYNKNKIDIKTHIFELFITSNLYSFVIQNSFIEKSGNDFLSINGVFSIIDFIYYIIEFFIIDLIQVNSKTLNIISIILLSLLELFYIILIIIFIIYIFIHNFYCDCNCVDEKKIKNLLKYLF